MIVPAVQVSLYLKDRSWTKDLLSTGDGGCLALHLHILEEPLLAALVSRQQHMGLLDNVAQILESTLYEARGGNRGSSAGW